MRILESRKRTLQKKEKLRETKIIELEATIKLKDKIISDKEAYINHLNTTIRSLKRDIREFENIIRRIEEPEEDSIFKNGGLY